jgi:hypothetical protein
LAGWLAARSWCFWVTIALLYALYAASFGPACRLVKFGYLPPHGTAVAFAPILIAACHGPWTLFNADEWYAGLFTNPGPDDADIFWRLVMEISAAP